MKLFNAACVALGFFVILRFPLLSIVEKSYRKSSLEKKRKKGFFVSLIEEGSSVLLTASLSFLSMLLVVSYINSQDGVTVKLITRALDHLDILRESFKTIKDLWTNGMLWFSLVGFTLLWYRTGRKHFENKFDKEVFDQRNDYITILNENPDLLEPLEPTKQMDEVVEIITRVEFDIQSLDPEDPNYNSKFGALTKVRESFINKYYQLDFERRVILPWDEQKELNHEVKLGDIIFSKGMLSDLKMVGKIFKFATLSLTFIGLISFSSGTVCDRLEEKYTRLDALRVAKSLKEAAKQRKNVITKAQEEENINTSLTSPQTSIALKLRTALTPEQAAALSEFSKEAIYSFTHNPDWLNTESTLPKKANIQEKNAVRREAVRYAILEHAQSNNTRIRINDNNFQPIEGALHSYSQQLKQGEKLNPAAAILYDDLNRIPSKKRIRFLENVTKWAREKQKSYTVAANVDELQSSWINEFINSIIPHPSESSSETFIQFHDVLSDAVKKSVNNGFQTLRDTMVLKAINGESPEHILNFIKSGDPSIGYLPRNLVRTLDPKLKIVNRNISTYADLNKEMEKHIASLNVQSEQNPEAIEVLKRISKRYREGKETNFANLLSSFESEFPNKGAAFTEFPRDKILSSWGASNTNDVSTRIKRTLSFDKLRNYSRVGGILFRDHPEVNTNDGQLLDVTDFWWEVRGKKLVLFMKNGKDSNPISIGQFSAYLVRQALSFAADNRPMVVTILTAPEIARRQVLLHPALVDTELGCRMILADQWIFNYTDSKINDLRPSLLRNQINRYGLEGDLYQLAWQAIKEPDKLRNITLKPLSRLQQLGTTSELESVTSIQKDLFRLAIKCGSDSPERFTECVKEASIGATWIEQVPRQKPQFGFVSQLMDAPYKINNRYEFIRASSSLSDGILPLEMTAQMTINDSEKLTFPNFDKDGVPLVQKGLQIDGKEQYFREVQQFTILQRFFRAALNGDLGPSFPLEKFIVLTDLAVQLDNSKKVRTPRWMRETTDGPTIESSLADATRYIQRGKGIKTHLSKKTSASVNPILETCASALSMPGVESVSNDRLSSKCKWDTVQATVKIECQNEINKGAESSNTAACMLFGLAKYAKEFVEPIHDLRILLGAATAMRADELHCPPPQQ